nr:MaoC/PaaZ C-terminal domain-containing protein [Fredinandcohnia onubensis]
MQIQSICTYQSPFFEDVKIGDNIPPLVKKPTHLQLFRYSAITWNTHRIHFDQKYAKEEGYPDVLVQSHLHGAFMTQLCTDWMGVNGEIKSMELSVRRFAVPGNTLTCYGQIVNKEIINNEGIVYIDLKEVNENGIICVPGNAVIKLPFKKRN